MFIEISKNWCFFDKFLSAVGEIIVFNGTILIVQGILSTITYAKSSISRSKREVGSNYSVPAQGFRALSNPAQFHYL